MTTDIRDQRRIDPSGSHTGQRGIRLRRLRGWCFASAIFIAVSALAGALTAGLGSQWFPRSLDIAKPPARSQVLMADGQVLASFFTENRVPVRLADIAPVMRQAIMAVEDHRFFQHGAVDLRGMIRALVHNATGQPGVQGGSSITQQYVKMSLVERCRGDEQCVKNATAATLARKVRELRYAVALEKQLTKDQILEGYLNTAYFGEGAYGVEAAAEHYFSTAAADLSLPQAAMLAGLVRAPDATNPVSHLNEAIKRRDFVISMMAQLQMISAHQADTARAASYSPHPTVVRSGCVGSPYPFICDFVRRTLLRQPSLGRTAAERTTMLNEGGLTIQTTIDPHVQDLAQARISDVVGPTDPLISTMNMIEPNTGRIIAMAQSRPVMGDDAAKGQTYWNLSADPSLGGAQGYQAGSTFKAFTAAAALEQGIPLSTQLDARHTIDSKNDPSTPALAGTTFTASGR